MISHTVSKNPKTQNCLYCLFVFYVNDCIHVSGNKKIYKKKKALHYPFLLHKKKLEKKFYKPQSNHLFKYVYTKLQFYT